MQATAPLSRNIQRMQLSIPAGPTSPFSRFFHIGVFHGWEQRRVKKEANRAAFPLRPLRPPTRSCFQES